MADKLETAVQSVSGETNAPRAEWVNKLRYTKSFLAKLCLSSKEIKENYSALFNALVAYEGVTAKTSFSCVTFYAKRKQVAIITLTGKTLNVHFALEPSSHSVGRYRLTDVSVKRRFSRVPAKYRVKSKGGLRFALKVVEETAAALSLSKRAVPLPPVTPKDFPSDSLGDLISRGLIRTMGGMDRRVARVTKEIPLYVEKETEKPTSDQDVYSDTVSVGNALTGRHEEYAELSDAFTGEGEIRFVKQRVVRAIDESWVRAIEDCLPALDEVTRNPSHFIEETEELLPIERTKKVTTRSIKHLCQHTGLISRIEGDVVIPSKLLNVFRDESVMTYENKFVNTLLTRLYDFVTMRYEEAEDFGANRTKAVFNYTDTVRQGEEIGKVSVSLEVSVPTEEKEKSAFFQSDLWARVKKLKGAITDYRAGEFATIMGNAAVRPPIVRTNPILKNKDLRQCLDLWEFLEGYDDDGAGVSVSENELDVPEVQQKFALQSAMQQYLLFRHFSGLAAVVKKEDQSAPTSSKEEKALAHPSERIDTAAMEPTPEEVEDETAFYVAVALQAEEIALTEWKEEQARILEERRALELEAEKEKAEKERLEKERIRTAVDTEPARYEESEPLTFADASAQPLPIGEDVAVVEGNETVVYVKSFAAKLRATDDVIKEYYCTIANALLAKEGVRERQAFDHADFYKGRRTIARVMLSGKTIRVYFLPLSDTLKAKYGVTDKADVKKFAATPCLVKVKGPRGLKRVLDLISELSLGADTGTTTQKTVQDFSPMAAEDALLAGEVRRRVLTEAQVERLRRIRLRPEAPREEYDYSAEVAAYDAEQAKKPKKVKELVIETDVSPVEIGKAILRAEAEEIASMPERQTPTIEGAGGDPLYARVEAMQNGAVSLEVPKDEEEETPVREEKKPIEVPPDGDVLTPKPITMESLTSGAVKPKPAPTPVPMPAPQPKEEKKAGFFSRLFGRKDKR